MSLGTSFGESEHDGFDLRSLRWFQLIRNNRLSRESIGFYFESVEMSTVRKGKPAFARQPATGPWPLEFGLQQRFKMNHVSWKWNMKMNHVTCKWNKNHVNEPQNMYVKQETCKWSMNVNHETWTWTTNMLKRERATQTCNMQHEHEPWTCQWITKHASDSWNMQLNREHGCDSRTMKNETRNMQVEPRNNPNSMMR